MENYQNNYRSTVRSVANQWKLKSKILPQLKENNSSEVVEILTKIKNHPNSCKKFEILSARDIKLLDSNMSSDDDDASVLSKGSIKKNMKF